MNMFIVISFTPHMNYTQRKKTIRKSILVAGAAVFAFAIIGQFILSGLNVAMSAMKLTGALLVGPAAYEMVVGHSIDDTKAARSDLHFFPIGIPTIAGPGVFTTVLITIKRYGIDGLVPTVLGILCALYATYIVINIGNKFFSNLDKIYIRMMSVFFGTILLALAAQFFIDSVMMITETLKSTYFV